MPVPLWYKREGAMDDNKLPLDLMTLSSSSWRERRRALENLARSDDATLTQALLEIIQKHHQDLGLLNGALQLLRMQKAPVLDRLGALLSDEDPEVRTYAALAIGEMGDPEGGKYLLAALADRQEEQPNVRFNLIEALGKLEVKEAVEPLVQVLEQGDFYLAYPAVHALSAIGDERAAPVLARLLPHPELGPAAAMALAQVAGEGAIPDLARWLESEEVEVGTAARALAEIGRSAKTAEQEQQIGQQVAALLGARGRQRLLEAAARSPVGRDRSLDRSKDLSPEQAAVRRSLAMITGWLLADSTAQDTEKDAMITVLNKMLRHPASRTAAAEALLHSGTGATKNLIDSLRDPDPEVRQLVMRVLAGARDAAAIPPLLEALDDALEAEEEDLAVQAVEALGKIGSPAAFEPLLLYLTNSSRRLKMALAAALAAIRHPHFGLRLVAKATDPDPAVRETALTALAYARYPEAAGVVLDAMQDPHPEVRRAAVSAAAELSEHIEAGQLVQALVHTLADPEPRVREASARALGAINPETALPMLHQALHDPDPWTRIHACHSLGRLARPESVPHLAALIEDPLAPVRIAVAEALSHIRGPEAQEILKGLLADPEIDVHKAVEVALTFFTRKGGENL